MNRFPNSCYQYILGAAWLAGCIAWRGGKKRNSIHPQLACRFHGAALEGYIQGKHEPFPQLVLRAFVFISFSFLFSRVGPLQWMALHIEGYKTYSEVERAVMSRYFFFHLANVFVTIGAGSIKDVRDAFLRCGVCFGG